MPHRRIHEPVLCFECWEVIPADTWHWFVYRKTVSNCVRVCFDCKPKEKPAASDVEERAVRVRRGPREVSAYR